MENYLKPSAENIKQLQASKIDGTVTMLNLLRFRDIADYSEHKNLQPETEILGQEAYDLYGKFTFPILKKYGAELLFKGKTDHFLIGPEAEKWDLILGSIVNLVKRYNKTKI
ncbi:MAG: hypothetical protein ACI81T_004459 [Bacteroidia bacterium]|jgi:hypothetical protein